MSIEPMGWVLLGLAWCCFSIGLALLLGPMLRKRDTEDEPRRKGD